MSSRTISKSKSVQGNTDLTLIAPIRQGLVDSVPAWTYESRLRVTLQTLDTLQATSKEFAPIRPLVDAVDRIRSIHSFRLAILEPPQQQPQLLLALTFDSGWEPYMRIVWQKLGALLDLMLCNCVDYVTACDHSYAEYTDWVRQQQVETGLFYTAAPLTVDDLQYLRQAEQLLEGSPATDLAGAQIVAARPADIAAAAAALSPDVADQITLGALAGLYGLAAMYPPQSQTDGQILLRAARLLLSDIGNTKTRFPDGSPGRFLFPKQLDWFEQAPAPTQPALPAAIQFNARGDVQGGIVKSYDATHAALLLIGFDDAASARAFLAALQVTSEADAAATSGKLDVTYTNIAFTYQGLHQLGLTDEQLNAFPQEFREGMEARSSILGDVRSNHPLNWSLPERNWPPNPGSVVQLSTVHAIVQLSVRSSSARVPGDHEVVGNSSHPLFQEVKKLADLLGTQLLSVQAMRRNTDPTDTPLRPRDHFGFADAVSQPAFGTAHGAVGKPWTNETTWGELLLGYPNDQDDPPLPANNPLVAAGLWANSSYLAIRKLSQDVGALNRMLDSGSAQCGLAGDRLKEKMMGRQLVSGDPLVNNPANDNSFTYASDPLGSQCPFQAHIRRANPRDTRERLVPRIVRRGMSYGPPYADDQNAERGLVFMAYNARIAEQFEAIQRWISGGNSTYVFSGESDPFLGVPQVGAPRTFRFQDSGRVLRIALDDQAGTPLVRLRWGTYLFVPSITALGKLIDIAAKVALPQADIPWSSDAGEQLIKPLLMLPADAAAVHWKAVLDDPLARLSHTTHSVWAAIRKNHGGVLRTPYGVLVGSHDLVMKVLQNDNGSYSVQGYAERLGDSFGTNYIGLDDCAQYQAESTAMNRAIMGVTEADAFDLARAATKNWLDRYTSLAKAYFAAHQASAWELPLDMGDVSDLVLYDLYTEWFGAGAKPTLEQGGWQWGWGSPADAPPRCPGHFIAPAVYVFQPNPGTMEQEFGKAHGKALLELFQAQGRTAGPTANLAQAAFAAFPNPADNDLLARTLVGVLAGFLPTAYACSRTCLLEWISDGTLWEMEAEISTGGQTYDQVRAVLGDRLCRTMQRSPGLELVWRTAVKAHQLGDVDVQPGDKIVVGLGSAAQEALEAGAVDCFALFGGDRSAAPHPQHACPGYAMGMGVLLGILTATIESRPTRPGPAPLALIWSGTLP